MEWQFQTAALLLEPAEPMVALRLKRLLFKGLAAANCSGRKTQINLPRQNCSLYYYYYYYYYYHYYHYYYHYYHYYYYYYYHYCDPYYYY